MISGQQDFFSSNLVGRIFFYSSARIFFYYICAACNFFLPTSACRNFFFQNHPPPSSRVKWSAPYLTILLMVSIVKSLKPETELKGKQT